MIEAVALLLSGVALVVSYVTLHLTVLRPAVIELDSGGSGDARADGYRSGFPDITTVSLPVFISNTGAKGGLLQNIGLGWDLEKNRGVEAVWSRLVPVGTFLTQSQHQPRVPLPLALEAGDARSLFVIGTMPRAGGDLETFAKAVRDLPPIRLVMTWDYVRTRGIADWRWLPIRLRRRREIKHGSVEVVIPIAKWRDRLLNYWRRSSHYATAVAILESK